MALDAAALLSSVESAITAIIGGASSYSIGARTVTHHDLQTLFEERRMLLAEVSRSSGGGMFRLAKFSRTSE
jgi:hypothetical protein